jgi:hypothetical protein
MSDIQEGRKPLFHIFLALCTLNLNKDKNSAQIKKSHFKAD